MRTACYCRYSSDLQRDTSLEDQIRSCREYAARHGWTWQDDQVFTDAAITGASIEGRDGLQRLLTAAADRPRDFDVLLVDDSSRVSRDLADALRIVQRLKFAGVRVIYISQGIDSDSEQHETLIAVHGLVDGLYLREMAAKIKRGLKGQLARGFATGGLTYGYRTQPVTDARGDAIGYAPVIEPSEARVIQQVFTWYGEGVSVPTIIARLTASGAPGPRGRVWRVGAVQRMLRNPKYVGRLVWGRTRQERRPGSRGKTRRDLPADQWQTLERPELRIVSDEAWARVEQRRRELDALLNRQAGTTLMRGRHPRVHSPALFSGFLTCGVCGHAVNVVGTHTVKGVLYRYYGCAHASRNGNAVCTNRVKVRAELAESALLSGLQAELLKPDTLAYVTDALRAALNEAANRRPAERADLERRIEATRQKLTHLLAAVEAGAGTTIVYQAIKDREADLRALESQRAALATPVDQRLAVVPTWVRRQLEDAAAVLHESPERAKTEFERMGVAFVVHPVYDEGPPFLRAVGTGIFDNLAFGPNTPFPPSGRSPQRAIGCREFVIDLRPVPESAPWTTSSRRGIA